MFVDRWCVEMTVFPEFSEFEKLARRGNFVPVCRQWVADLDTPVSAWYKICSREPYSFLLESVEGGERLGRYSFLSCDPLWILETRGQQTTQTFREGTIATFEGDPFAVLSRCLEPFHPVKLPELPPGLGGLFGFWGYELISWVEPRVPICEPKEDDLPDGLWMQVDSLLVFDRVQNKIYAIAYADLRDRNTKLRRAYREASDRATRLAEKLLDPLSRDRQPLEAAPPTEDNFSYTSTVSKEQFCDGVRKAKEYIKNGDIFQVVLSQRLEAEYEGDPFLLYRSLRSLNPSPYMAYFNFNGWQLIGSSPEVMVKAEVVGDRHRRATVRPIAGTRPRGKTEAEDLALGEELLADPKEVAEHIMLVDLGRNDLGRVCENGSVRVDELMVIERYSHVMHIVSNVIGELAPGQTAWDLLKACFPAGTVSGAPKIRAMEIIHELEGVRRGPYSGVYGYYDFEGQLNSAITIRTMIVRQKDRDRHTVFVQAGAGLVADSDPETEYQETLNKAKGLLEAIRYLR